MSPHDSKECLPQVVELHLNREGPMSMPMPMNHGRAWPCHACFVCLALAVAGGTSAAVRMGKGAASFLCSQAQLPIPRPARLLPAQIPTVLRVAIGRKAQPTNPCRLHLHLHLQPAPAPAVDVLPDWEADL